MKVLTKQVVTNAWVWSRAIGCVELKDVMSYTTQHINENNIVGIEPCKPESLQTTSVLVFFCLMYIASGKWSMRWQCTHLGSTRSPAEGKYNSHKFLQSPNGTTGSTILHNINKTYAPLIHSRCVFFINNLCQLSHWCFFVWMWLQEQSTDAANAFILDLQNDLTKEKTALTTSCVIPKGQQVEY